MGLNLYELDKALQVEWKAIVIPAILLTGTRKKHPFHWLLFEMVHSDFSVNVLRAPTCND